MQKQITNQKTIDRRRQIIVSALECFSQTGLIDTTMEEIRQKAGVSNGSLYHHFKNKEQLATAVYLEGILVYQLGMLEALKKCKTARDGIYTVVAFHLNWVQKQPEWARYLFQTHRRDLSPELESSMIAANKDFFMGMEMFFKKYVKDHTLKDFASEILFSLILGPCQEYTRFMLMKNCKDEVETAISQIAESIWLALKA